MITFEVNASEETITIREDGRELGSLKAARVAGMDGFRATRRTEDKGTEQHFEPNPSNLVWWICGRSLTTPERDGFTHAILELRSTPR